MSITTKFKLLPPHLQAVCKRLASSPNANVFVYEGVETYRLQRDGVEPMEFEASGCTVGKPTQGGAFGEIWSWDVTLDRPDAVLAYTRGYRASTTIWLQLRGALPRKATGVRRLSQFERDVLSCFKGLKAFARPEAMQRLAAGYGGKAPWDWKRAVKELTWIGLLKENKAGAVSLSDLGLQTIADQPGDHYRGFSGLPNVAELADAVYDPTKSDGERNIWRDMVLARGGTMATVKMENGQ